MKKKKGRKREGKGRGGGGIEEKGKKEVEKYSAGQ